MNTITMTKKITSGFLGAVFVVSLFTAPIAVNKAEAQASGLSNCAASAAISALSLAMGIGTVARGMSIMNIPVVDPANIGLRAVKEQVFDCMAYTTSKYILSQINQDILKWVGGTGLSAPKFVVNYEDYFDDALKNTTKTFIFDKLSSVELPGNIQLNVQTLLTKGTLGTTFEDRLEYTFPEEYQDFIDKGDFSSGGWDAYLSFNQNNSFETYLTAKKLLQEEKRETVQSTQSRYIANSGFLNIRQCVQEGTAGCLKYKIQTPGQLIENQVANVLGSRVRQLEMADELNEIFAIAFQSIFSDIFGSGSTGLLSSPESSGGSDPSSAPTPFEFNRELLVQQIDNYLVSQTLTTTQRIRIQNFKFEAQSATTNTELQSMETNFLNYISTISPPPANSSNPSEPEQEDSETDGGSGDTPSGPPSPPSPPSNP